MPRPLLLLAALCAAARADGPLNKDLLDLAADLDAGKDVTAKAAAFRKKHDDLADVMKAFKPRKNGGIGHGPPRPADGIEFAIYDLSKKAATEDLLATQKDALLRLAALNRAMSRLTALYEPGGLNPVKRAEWRRQQAAMEKSSLDLASAVRKGDPGMLKRAAEGINSACVKCHEACR
ncbi:MAG: hypothetical protein ACRC33_08400 [Gemmataceae bacterium]